MPARRSQILAIFFTVLVDVLGFGIVIPTLPLYAEHLAATPFEIGALVGIFSLLQFVFAPVWGAVSDRFGRRPVILIGLVATAAGYFVMALGAGVGWLFAGRILSGIAGANLGAAQAYLADISPPESRARAMGLIGAAFGIGLVFGPALGGIAGGLLGYQAPLVLAGLLALGNAVFAWVAVPESLSKEARTASRSTAATQGWLLRHVRHAPYFGSLAAHFLCVTAFSMMTTVFALYLQHRFALDIVATGGILAGLGALGAAIQGGLTGPLTARFGEPGLALAGAVSLSAGMGVLALAAAIPWVLAGAAAVGIGNSLLMPALASMASRAAEAGWQGRALGLLQSAGSLARFLGPVACGLLLAAEAHRSPYGFLPLSGAFAVALASAAACVGLRRASRSWSPFPAAEPQAPGGAVQAEGDDARQPPFVSLAQTQKPLPTSPASPSPAHLNSAAARLGLRGMELTDAQKATLKSWIEAGAGVAEVQKRLKDEMGISLTYLETRLLFDDLKLAPKDPEKPKEPAPLLDDKPSAENKPGKPGGVSVTVDHLARPGAVISGKVTFSDGETAEWFLDVTGRLALNPTKPGYRPSQKDVMDFQLELDRAAREAGY